MSNDQAAIYLTKVKHESKYACFILSTSYMSILLVKVNLIQFIYFIKALCYSIYSKRQVFLAAKTLSGVLNRNIESSLNRLLLFSSISIKNNSYDPYMCIMRWHENKESHVKYHSHSIFGYETQCTRLIWIVPRLVIGVNCG